MSNKTIVTGIICTIGGILIADRYRTIHNKGITETVIDKIDSKVDNIKKEEKELSVDEVKEKIKKFDEDIQKDEEAKNENIEENK